MTANNAVNTYLGTTSNNEITMPGLCAFNAYLASDDNNETGNGTTFILGDTDVGTALTEIFDQNSDFTTGSSSGATFTAPVTEKYIIMVGLRIGSVGTTTGEYNKLVTSNRDYVIVNWNAGLVPNAADELFCGCKIMCDMDSSDTAVFSIFCTGAGGDTVDVQGSATIETYFMGYLAI